MAARVGGCVVLQFACTDVQQNFFWANGGGEAASVCELLILIAMLVASPKVESQLPPPPLQLPLPRPSLRIPLNHTRYPDQSPVNLHDQPRCAAAASWARCTWWRSLPRIHAAVAYTLRTTLGASGPGQVPPTESQSLHNDAHSRRQGWVDRGVTLHLPTCCSGNSGPSRDKQAS